MVWAVILLIVRIIKLSRFTVIELVTVFINIDIKAFNSLAELKADLTCICVNDNGISNVIFELKNFAVTLGW